MYGCLEQKLEDKHFIECFDNCDIIGLSECWINKNSNVKLCGYEEFKKPRKRRKHSKRDSGGLVVYFKNNIFGGVSQCDWDFEDGLVFKLCKFFFGFIDDVYILFPYMRSASSSKNVIDAGIDIISKC